MPEIPLLGQAAANARKVQTEPPAEADAPIEVETAFLVYRLADGQVVANTDIDTPVVIEREAHPHDIIGMSHAVIGDVDTMSHAQFLANAVVGTQQMAMRAAFEQQQHMQVQQKLAQQKPGGRG